METGCCETQSSTGCFCWVRSRARSRIPDALRDRYPDVAWRQIRAFRNLAVHKYFSIDWAVVWQISREEVPVLEEQAMDIMRAEFPELAKTYEPETTVEPGPDDTAEPGQEQTA
jgi:hypothetical protein